MPSLLTSFGFALAGASAAMSAVGATYTPTNARSMWDNERVRRSTTTDWSQVAGKSFDYVIAGGGQAGLALASRLSEDSSVTVAVIEAGINPHSNATVANSINQPLGSYFNSRTGTAQDWQYMTVQQPNVDNRNISWPRGKVLGGSSATNGLYLVRHSEIEQQAWVDLVGTPTANDTWSWDKMLAAMKKSETFTPPTSSVVDVVDIHYLAENHGTSGPIHYSYPGYEMPAVGLWFQTLNGVGVETSPGPDGGQSFGAFVTTSAINPSNWTRSTALSGYIDPYDRPNLTILTEQMVTRILFNETSGTLVASGVEFASSSGAPRVNVTASREVIVSGGSVNTPQILQLSGIGPSNVLNAANVDVLLDLPGVGMNLQDHLSTSVSWTTTSETANSSFLQDTLQASYVNSAIAYPNLSTLLGGENAANQFLNQARANMTTAVNALNADDTVKAGYQAQYNMTVEKILTTQVAPIELLLSLTSTGTVQVQAALQRPFSRGSVAINSNDPFDYPSIDPHYLESASDLTLLSAGLQMARKVAETAPLSTILGTETQPGSAVSTNADWETWLRTVIGTEFHPAATSSMLPRNLGGVVDEHLIVYGTKNVRVVDASVVPLSISAHLMAPTYGIAEIAAEIIAASWKPANSSSTTSGGSSPTPSSIGSVDGKNAGAVGVSAGHHLGLMTALLGLVAAGVVVAL